ncbi:uncharacterized protein LOC117100085 [Anneissia japonica]|uniref:uncharacterized protein LOC117100085 n=1 Tax=Anneissia japonica TaxID=1529436 RepID=UPI0014258CB9|nr:uncharacterized protein LOC117100085 [Anneissia japonica]XP_033095524.1 uncharacterized protein LOC117100085 [Anneissia japonica]
MDKKATNLLKGYITYDRSFNKRVLAADTEIHEAYKIAQERGALPFNRTKILILGDHAAGKTSTCRRLQGKDFRNDEASTVGIETNTVKAKVCDVNSSWCKILNTPLEDYESSAAWWAVSHVRKRDMKKATKDGSTPEVNLKVTLGQIVEDIFYQIIHNIPIIITFLIGGFTFGFGLFVWTYIVCLMYIFDVHTAYRFGSGYAIGMVLIDSAMGIEETYTELQDSELDLWFNMSAVMMAFMYGLVGLITGVLMGSGGRTGVCIALCIMVHPKQKTFTIDNVTEQLLVIYGKAYYNLIICIIALVFILIFKLVHARMLTMSRRNFSLVIFSATIFITAATFIIRPCFLSIFTTSYIAVIVSCTSVGTILGRKSVAYGYIPQIYIFKKTVGFMAGIFIAVVCGWELADVRTLRLDDSQYVSTPRHLFNLLLFFTPFIAFIAYELHAYMRVRNTTSIPIHHVRQSMKASIRNESYLDARLSLWDFAGQDMYYNTHHLFLSKQGVYLVLFNAVEAVLNPEKQIQRLQFWLQSIAMHAEVENVVVFLVGTRRDSVNDTNALMSFLTLAKEHLYIRFSTLLAFHPSGSLFFLIENALQVDYQRNILRAAIYDEIQKLTFFQETFSVKYLLFNESLNKFRLQKCIITKLEEISEEVKSRCNITSQNELRQFLNFFDRSGDVIYNERDEILRKFVICDPQMLVDILQYLVNVPAPHKRNRTVADYWQRLKDTGIVDSRLLEHICRQKGIWTLYPYVIRFLVGTHLLFPLNVTDQVDQVGTFLLSCQLPKITLMSSIWNRNDCSQTIFYIDFGEIIPEFIFLRLIAKCCEMFTWDKIYYNAARFRISKSCLFVISTTVIFGSINSYDRNLIKIAVHNEDHAEFINVVQKMINFTEEIINRDFNPDYFQNQYIYGPECEQCSLLDGTMCLVNLITPGNDMSSLDGYKPDHYHKLTFERKFSLTCSRLMNN